MLSVKLSTSLTQQLSCLFVQPCTLYLIAFTAEENVPPSSSSLGRAYSPEPILDAQKSPPFFSRFTSFMLIHSFCRNARTKPGEKEGIFPCYPVFPLDSPLLLPLLLLSSFPTLSLIFALFCFRHYGVSSLQ